ncbi:MAG: MaoC family dehydratase N-terminal domain-containing protein [Pseudomonadota bacterium]
MLSAEVMESCRSFIGKFRTVTDSMAIEPAAKLATLLNADLRTHLPVCWHWAYFNPAIPPNDVGHDGHERLGLFLPDVPLPRRMWAAGEIEITKPLELSAPATRRSRIEDVAFKEGRTGDLCFVTVLHEIDQSGPAITERQTIVYREAGQPEQALRAPLDPIPDGYTTVADSTLLAYSAITQNGHRIHWDRDFCRDVENYPDLVVHGPLLATLLAGALLPEPGPSHYTYRATAPVFVTSPFRIRQAQDTARIERADGTTAMEAQRR